MSLTRADLEAGRLQAMISKAGLNVHILSEEELQESIRQTLGQHDPSADVWVFAYGSLIWNPVFTFVERRVGTIYGWHRQFCLWTPAGRGSSDNRGLVLGLDHGGSCRGIAFRIAAADVLTELRLVWRREMVVGSYVPRWVKVMDRGHSVQAIAFTINRQQRSYAGKLPLDVVVDSIATATGSLGSCSDYLMQTVDGLLAADIKDKYLLLLRDRVIARQHAQIR